EGSQDAPSGSGQHYQDGIHASLGHQNAGWRHDDLARERKDRGFDCHQEDNAGVSEPENGFYQPGDQILEHWSASVPMAPDERDKSSVSDPFAADLPSLARHLPQLLAISQIDRNDHSAPLSKLGN